LLPHVFINPIELHFYTYVSSNSVNWIDPKGLRILDPKCSNKPKPWPPESCPPPEWFIYNSHYCCEERCYVFWGLDKWYHWVTPTGVAFGIGNFMGCVISCSINSSSY